MEMLYVLKFGGNAIRGRKDLDRLSKEVRKLRDSGAAVIMVHGGGPEINEELERRGIVPVKVDGLRLTDAQTMDAVEYALSALNKQVVESLFAAGVRSEGIAAADFTVSEKLPPYVSKEGKKVDLGLVGDVVSVDSVKLIEKAHSDTMPVLYPVGSDKAGNRLNVNADSMAAGIAAAVKCDEMVQITDVPGVMLDVKDPSSVQPLLTLAEVDRFIADGTISGGMIPKVEACRSVILAGVKRVRMVNGKDPETPMLSGTAGTVITE